MLTDIVLRAFNDDDDLAALTGLIHAAYAPHAARGRRYWGTHQSVDDTRQRFAQGQGFVATASGRYLGTITLRPPQPQSKVALYRDPRTWTFGQFAVHPDLKGSGLGRRLHDHAIAVAQAQGATAMACDTAASAHALVAMYARWGYAPVGEADWRPHTNYVSVVLRKFLEIPEGP